MVGLKMYFLAARNEFELPLKISWTYYNKICRYWSIKDKSLQRQFETDICGTEMHISPDEKLIIFDGKSQIIKVYDLKDGKIYCNSLPQNIMSITLTNKNSNIFYSSFSMIWWIILFIWKDNTIIHN